MVRPMLHTRLTICLGISTVLSAVAWTEPSSTPSHIVSRIPRQAVESSAIAKVGYSKRRHMLEIEFVNGAVYRYLEVPATMYSDLVTAATTAHFSHWAINGQYDSGPVR